MAVLPNHVIIEPIDGASKGLFIDQVFADFQFADFGVEGCGLDLHQFSRTPFSADYDFEDNDLIRAKKVLGDTLCFMGNLSNFLLATGAIEQVRDHTKVLIDNCGTDGGYIMSGGFLIDYARPENVDAWVTTTKDYGRYQ